MKPLREEEASTPLMKDAQRLLASLSPLPESTERMRRVRRAIEASDRQPGWLVALQRTPALAAALVVALLGASAFAAVRIYDKLAPHVDESLLELGGSDDHRRRAKPGATADGDVAIDESAEEIEYVQDTLEADDRDAPRERRAGPRSRVRTPITATSAAGDSELVHRALRALRRDDDAALAARLLEDYRARNPEGPLAEEALALQIEAAERLDEPRARKLATQYLTRYPDGRYRGAARHALQSETVQDVAP